MARAAAAAAKKLDRKAKEIPVVVKSVRKARTRHWWDRKIKLWQAILLALGAVWVFWIFWAVGYVQGQFT